jgi:tRNA(fMet)-specific endonuclease VapC
VKLLLDTDICMYAMKQEPTVLQRLLATAPSDVAVSTITEGELRAGAAKSSEPVKTARRVEAFLAPLTLLEFTSDDARSYAEVRARLERAGTPIGPMDSLIAGQALARKLTLVTNNEREFRRVNGLKTENWRRAR